MRVALLPGCFLYLSNQVKEARLSGLSPRQVQNDYFDNLKFLIYILFVQRYNEIKLKQFTIAATNSYKKL